LREGLLNKTMSPDIHDIPIVGDFYTKKEVDKMVADALAEARAIDEASMRKHNRDATIISMILGFTCLALFVDGLLRILGIIPPFMDLDVSVVDDIVDIVEERVSNDIMPIVQDTAQKAQRYIPGRW
tara:strand:+ start:108 stop:488 length:381 start_codon:yes stop_codon:yes gene_type:complete